MVPPVAILVVALVAGTPTNDFDWDAARTPTFSIGGGFNFPYGIHLGGTYWLSRLFAIESSISHARILNEEAFAALVAGSVRVGRQRTRRRLDGLLRVGVLVQLTRSYGYFDFDGAIPIGIAQLGFSYVDHAFSVDFAAGVGVGLPDAARELLPYVTVTFGWVRW